MTHVLRVSNVIFSRSGFKDDETLSTLPISHCFTHVFVHNPLTQTEASL